MATIMFECGCSVTTDMFTHRVLWVYPCLHHTLNNEEIHRLMETMAEVVKNMEG